MLKTKEEEKGILIKKSAIGFIVFASFCSALSVIHHFIHPLN
jgi:hypothetical protein